MVAVLMSTSLSNVHKMLVLFKPQNCSSHDALFKAYKIYMQFQNAYTTNPVCILTIQTGFVLGAVPKKKKAPNFSGA
ncbi:hypothetical protein VAE151_560530 [Vibrio aestuarianus]|nr:hypothetical protein VAE115_321173 [Vibrio aestuarianus]CAH8217300.1 hypothetical protein VAE016_371172 [Vibrio aestuarianus]CAH8218913.1 hypothetical protein VAE151_560530 [Vibrio aestuarianus]CAH8220939.1 hypothetical protein VAE122_2980164 [Vibrio aestuarianus]